MRVERLFVTDDNWRWIEQLLRPAIDKDGNSTVAQVREKLKDNAAGLASLHVENGAALIVIEPRVESGVPVLWIDYFAGKVRGGPRHWLSVVRQGVRYFEDRAREAGQRETRLGGRDWSLVLTDYEHYDPDHPNRIRKVL